MKFLHIVIMVLTLGCSTLFGTEFKVDSANSHVGFKVKHMLFSTVSGSFGKFEGSFSKDENSNHISSIIGTADVETISTENEKRDNFIKSEDFFDIQKYPKMKLKLLEHIAGKVLVELTIKDIVKNVQMSIKDIKERSFVLSGKINRKDFDLSFDKFSKVGGLTVGNTVKINIKLTAY